MQRLVPIDTAAADGDLTRVVGQQVLTTFVLPFELLGAADVGGLLGAITSRGLRTSAWVFRHISSSPHRILHRPVRCRHSPEHDRHSARHRADAERRQHQLRGVLPVPGDQRTPG